MIHFTYQVTSGKKKYKVPGQEDPLPRERSVGAGLRVGGWLDDEKKGLTNICP